jgi:hypothetical protein
MRNFWIVPGIEDNWRQAFLAKGIWGLQETPYHKLYWLAIAQNDIILFHVSGKVKKIVGYGTIRNKFYQDIPLWKTEIEENRVQWPLRFEFDVDFLLDENRWKDEGHRPLSGVIYRNPLILIEREKAESVVNVLNPNAPRDLFKTELESADTLEDVASPTHDRIKELLQEVERYQAYITEIEYPMGKERLDVVWRRLPESVPTYVFEVQVGGDLYHAMGKLKHAHDIWNSRIFLVASADVLGSVNQLLAGTFHELQPIFRFIEIEKIQSLHKSKLDIYKLERELGIIP